MSAALASTDSAKEWHKERDTNTELETIVNKN
jgi:hypothetical protein